MNTCKTCTHWQPNDNHWSKSSPVKRCNRVKMYWDSTEWSDDGEERTFTDDSLAFVQDGSDYHAELLTKADFGCVMWESE